VIRLGLIAFRNFYM